MKNYGFAWPTSSGALCGGKFSWERITSGNSGGFEYGVMSSVSNFSVAEIQREIENERVIKLKVFYYRKSCIKTSAFSTISEWKCVSKIDLAVSHWFRITLV